ncbi:transposase [Catenovulum sp. SX2]|uniref:transposase n=1 Tax=Catenovulum sp. SX2 TaxID=3398614 RepID=UPI003F879158
MSANESLAFKLKCIEAVVHSNTSLCTVAEQNNVGKRKLLQWITQYRRGELYRQHINELNQLQYTVVELERQLKDLRQLTKMLNAKVEI